MDLALPSVVLSSSYIFNILCSFRIHCTSFFNSIPLCNDPPISLATPFYSSLFFSNRSNTIHPSVLYSPALMPSSLPHIDPPIVQFDDLFIVTQFTFRNPRSTLPSISRLFYQLIHHLIAPVPLMNDEILPTRLTHHHCTIYPR